MCGFAGVVAWDERHRVDRESLERMSALVAHRGPDGEGVFLNHDGEPSREQPQVGLVHRRLAILDPDPRASQPFHDLAGRSIVFNGEIYNFRELRAELSSLRPDYVWRTSGDTEVLLRAWEAWGPDCCGKLNGMFAFAVWDASAATLFLARDRMGQKPLYYAVAPGDGPAPVAVAFASELPALRPIGWIDRAIDPCSVADYLRRGYIPGGSIYKDVQLLPPSTRLTIDARGCQASRYFSPNAVGDAGSREPEAPADTTRRLVTQAVRRQLVSDVPVGCFLSGGIDSSIVAAAMRAAVPKGQPVLTFTIGFNDPSYDETGFAEVVARHLGTEHRAFTVKPDAADDLPKLAAAFGEPFGDSSALPTHYLARETRKHVKVALSGDGGDELFGGYDRYRAMRLGARIDAMPAARAILASRAWQRLPGSHPKGRLSRLKRFLAPLSDAPPQRYARYVGLFDDPLLADLLHPDLAAALDGCATGGLAEEYAAAQAGDRALQVPPRDDVQAALAADRVGYLPGDLLTKVDRASMLHALEVRSPFMDHDLVRFAAGLSTDELLRGGPKRLLRKAFARDLPSAVFKRTKMGFGVPIGTWFRAELREMLRGTLLSPGAFAAAHFRRATIERMIEDHERHRADHSQRLYALLMLELWWRTVV